MTLIELVAALALASVAVLGALGVLRAVGTSALADGGGGPLHDTPESRTEDLLTLLRDDLGRASWIASEENRLPLLGYSALDPGNHQHQTRPVRIEYRVAELESGRWIVRSQRRLDVRTNEPDHTRLVGPAPHLVLIVPILDDPIPPPGPAGNAPSTSIGRSRQPATEFNDRLEALARRERMTEMPSRVRLSLMLRPDSEEIDRRMLITR